MTPRNNFPPTNMKYNADKYTRAGVGELITNDTFVAIQLRDETWREPVLVAENYPELLGLVVRDDDEEVGHVFFRLNKEGYASGSHRSNATGRGRFDLIPYEAMLSLAKRYEMGAVHFGDRNWEKGQPLSRLLSSMRRHSHQIGYDFAEDHAGAVLWNAAAFVTMVERMRAGILPRELDDIGYFTNEAAVGGAK